MLIHNSNSTYYVLAQAGAVGHDVAAGGALDAGQGLGARV